MKNESINSEQSPIVGRLVQAGQLKDTHGETVHGVLIDCGEAMLQNVKLPPELWDRLDALRGELTRSAWIAAKIKNARL